MIFFVNHSFDLSNPQSSSETGDSPILNIVSSAPPALRTAGLAASAYMLAASLPTVSIAVRVVSSADDMRSPQWLIARPNEGVELREFQTRRRDPLTHTDRTGFPLFLHALDVAPGQSTL